MELKPLSKDELIRLDYEQENYDNIHIDLHDSLNSYLQRIYAKKDNNSTNYFNYYLTMLTFSNGYIHNRGHACATCNNLEIQAHSILGYIQRSYCPEMRKDIELNKL